MPLGYVSIPFEEYAELKRESDFLAELRAAGVDNWPGYDGVISTVYAEDDDEDF